MDEQNSSRSHSLIVAASLAAFLLVTFGFAFGPINGFAARGHLSLDIVRLIYAPIIYGTDHSQLAASVFDSYASLFVPTVPPEKALSATSLTRRQSVTA